MPTQTNSADQWNTQHLHLAIDAAGVALWAWNVDTDALTMDANAFDLWGLPWNEHVAFSDLSARIHPADRDRVGAAFAATRATLGAYETDFRILVGEEVRWIAARGKGADDGIVSRTMYGVFLNVTARKQAEEGHELLAGEMSHRLKNLLSIASALTTISSRSAGTIEEMTRELISRLGALGRAQDLVRPLPNGQGGATLLGDLLTVLLAPYDDLGAFRGRLRVAVERVGVGQESATALALVFHELATNSVKYGALSVTTGTLDISTRSEGDEVVLTWLEQGGPQINREKAKSGFGSRLVERTVAGQLSGEISHHWDESGLAVTLRLGRPRLQR